MIAVFAGSGELPQELYKSFKAKGESYIVIKCSSEMLPLPDDVPCMTIQWGKVGATLDFLHQHKVKRIVLAGAVSRPEKLSDLKVDWRGLQWLNSLRSVWNKGDDSLLKAVMNLFEKEGFTICSTSDFLEPLESITSYTQPTNEHIKSIRLGIEALKALSPYDVGQALVAAGNRILGIEGPEGTDELIRRCAPYMGDADAILVKMAKAGQSLKVDRPTIGAQTMQLLSDYGYKGVAFEQQTTNIMQVKKVVEISDQYKIFIFCF